ncbi:MAG: type II secretion system F family protein [Bacillota bacterium]|nr:type II secretion system F family protein [Bacillota bacterium]
MKKKLLSKNRINDICLSMHMMLKSGINAGECFELMSQDEPDGEYKEMLMEMAERADSGESVQSVFKNSGCFPEYVEGLIGVGERTGRIEEAFLSLAGYYDYLIRTEQRIRAALVYPVILMTVMMAVIVVLLVKVLPVFDSVYRQLGSGLEGIAGGLLKFGRILDSIMPLILVILAAAVIFAAAVSLLPGFRTEIIKIWNRFRGTRGAAGMMNSAKVFRAAAMGMKSGLSMDETMELAAEMMDDVPEISEKCRKCAVEIIDGASLADCLKKHGLIPAAEHRLLETGLRGGMGDGIVDEITKRLSEAAEDAIETRTSYLETGLVIVTALLVGLILLSVMLPLANIMSAIG